ncbi:ionotropic receptor 75a-like [Arctopsyche grandis]|uniref:ionotropic receptor 75a-like n=1 Tax=Arctopsyche grandis TaxID=121162 RepID=UPI00406D6F52
MDKTWIFVYLFLILSPFEVFSAININKNEYSYAVTFLKDFLLNDAQISHIVAFLCWSTGNEGYYAAVHVNCTKKNLYEFSENKVLYVLDTSCSFAGACLNLANDRKLFKSPNKWVVMDGFTSDTENFQSTNTDRSLSSTENNTKIVQTFENNCDGVNSEKVQLDKCPITFMSNLTLLVDSEVVIARRRTEFQNILLFYIFKRRKNLNTIVWEDFGYWNKKTGLVDTRLSRITAIRRLNLQKTPLISSVVILNPDSINHMAYDEQNRVDTLTKVNFILATHLVDFLNGTPKYLFVPTWGGMYSNGSFYGMLGQVIYGEADIGSTPMFFTIDRTKVIDYISMTTKTGASFVFREPPLSSVANIFVLPFEWTVWVTIIIFVALSCMALYFTNAYEDKLTKKETKREDAKTTVELGELCLIAIGAVAQQGTSIEPRSIAGRIVNLMLFFTLMFLYVSYSANIVALLQSQSNSIKTLSDLLNSKLKLGSEDNLYNRYYFQAYSDPIRKAIYSQKIAPKGETPHFYAMKEGVKRMRTELFAFHMEYSVGYKYVNDLYREDEKCGLQEVQYFDMTYPWFSIQKNISFKEMFKIGMRRIHETGLQSRENQRFYTKKPICSSSATFISVGLVDIRPALIFLGCGISVAVVLFIMEMLIKYRSYLINRIQGRLMYHSSHNQSQVSTAR